MEEGRSVKQLMKRFSVIVLPIFITQIALYLMTFFDILMTGRYDTFHLAGVTIGSSFWVPIYTGIAGIILGLTPILAQLVGAKKSEEIRPTLQQGFYISIALGLFMFLLLIIGVRPILQWMDLDEPVRAVAENYLYGMSYGLFPLFAYTALRSFFDSLGATRVSMIVILLSAPINICLNYILIYGKFGFPELGGAGAGYASGITYWIVLLIASIIALKRQPFKKFAIYLNWIAPSFQQWGKILKIGVPIGLAIFVETSIFSVVTLMMSRYTAEIIAAHQIALNFTSLLYMVPLSISMGTTIIVGQAVGAREWLTAKHASYLAISCAIFFSILSILILLIGRGQIATLYTTDPTIINLSMHFFIYAAFFQLSDAVMAPVQGALRGYKDVNMTFIIGLVSFWLIGLPVGYVMATYTVLGPYGFWIGLITGLSVGAIILGLRLRKIQQQTVQFSFALQQEKKSGK